MSGLSLNPPGAVRWIVRTLEDAGFETWAVGGAVRDALLGLHPGDWDLATRARPGQVRRIFRRTVPVGMEHGTVGVLARDGHMYEVTTFRKDVETTGRHATVAFSDDIRVDLARRDFTINALAWHPIREEILDPFGGRGDLEEGVLRTVGDPGRRFAEDYLRVLRALRFAGRFGLSPDPGTWGALCQAVPHLGILSAERIREEILKTLQGNARPSGTLSLYHASGSADLLLPELADAWEPWPWLPAVDLLPPARPLLRLTAWLSPLGWGRPGAAAAARILEGLRFSNAEIQAVGGLLDALGNDLPLGGDPLGPEIRRWCSRVGRGRVHDVLRVRFALGRLDPSRWGPTPELLGLARAARGVLRSGAPLEVGELAVSGRDLIRRGLKPGPRFGTLLQGLLEEVLEDPSRNETDTLLERALREVDGAGEAGRGEAGVGEDGAGEGVRETPHE